MVKNYLIHTKDGNKVFTAEEIIENAKMQEAEGIAPHYYYRHTKNGELDRPGWLVWSTWEDGAGVVYKLDEGRYMILEGWQSDFIYN